MKRRSSIAPNSVTSSCSCSVAHSTRCTIPSTKRKSESRSSTRAPRMKMWTNVRDACRICGLQVAEKKHEDVTYKKRRCDIQMAGFTIPSRQVPPHPHRERVHRPCVQAGHRRAPFDALPRERLLPRHPQSAPERLRIRARCAAHQQPHVRVDRGDPRAVSDTAEGAVREGR